MMCNNDKFKFYIELRVFYEIDNWDIYFIENKLIFVIYLKIWKCIYKL